MPGKTGHAKYLDEYIDPIMEIEPDWTEENEADEQTARLTEISALATLAKEIPRRLGGDATTPELKEDKVLCRRIKKRAETALRVWGGEPADVTEYLAAIEQDPDAAKELHIRAAQVDWSNWWADEKVFLQNRARFVANHALKLQNRKLANRLVNHFELEYRQFEDILGELV